jgi:hypothetical protein
MLTNSLTSGSSILHSADGRARITVTPVQRGKHGAIIDMEVLLNPDTREGTIPNKWHLSWIANADVIEANFEPFVEKYCPEPDTVLTLFRELRTAHLSFP